MNKEDICDDPKCNCKNVEPNFRVWLHDDRVTPSRLEELKNELIQSCKELDELYAKLEDDGHGVLLPGAKQRNKDLIEFLESKSLKFKVN